MLEYLGVKPEDLPQPKVKRKSSHAESGALTKAAIRLLTMRGYFVWRQNTGSLFAPIGGGRYRPVQISVPGIADICGVSPRGRAVYFEVKVGADKMRDTQIAFRDAVVKRGALYVEVRCIEDVENAITLDAAQ